MFLVLSLLFGLLFALKHCRSFMFIVLVLILLVAL